MRWAGPLLLPEPHFSTAHREGGCSASHRDDSQKLRLWGRIRLPSRAKQTSGYSEINTYLEAATGEAFALRQAEGFTGPK